MDLEQTYISTSPVPVLVWTKNSSLRERLLHLLSSWAEEACVDLSLQHQAPPFAGGADPGGILFLDAEGLGDLPAAELEQRRHTALVVVSADKRTAIQAYRWHPTAFLKPSAGYHSLRQAMDQCFPFWRQGLQWIDLPFRRDRVRVPLCQLHCVEAEGRESILYCAGGQMRASYPLGKLGDALPSPPFFRCQRGFLVHLCAVEAMSGGALVLKDGHRTIPVSRQQIKKIQQALHQWQAARGD